MAIGIALIGSGIFAKEQHLPAIQATPNLKLRAIYSRSLASAQSLSEGLQDVDLYSEDRDGYGFNELLKREDVRGVLIALPIPVQPEYIKRALSAGKHVLAEKPIAKDVATATELLNWYNSKIKMSDSAPMFTIAENFRFLDSYIYAAEQISGMGRVLQFHTRVSSLVQPGGKYFETAWRKVPEYQGGFLLDGGVHFIAATRLMLGSTNAPIQTSAFTAQLQPHLPPVDTVDATVKLRSGGSGTISLSFGTTWSGSEYNVACEKGTVSVSRGKVVISRNGQEDVKEFSVEGAGVQPEVKAWAESLENGQMNPQQSPEEALKDLELIEAMLTSGEKGGVPIDLN